jgi:hypothetical protein
MNKSSFYFCFAYYGQVFEKPTSLQLENITYQLTWHNDSLAIATNMS